MNKVVVYQDGKLCRNVDGILIKNLSKRVLIKFTIDEYDEELESWETVTKSRWFRRRRREGGGVYECIGWNYWFFRSRGTV